MAKADPQDKDNRIQFSNKLRELLNLRNKKQIDLHRDLGIPKSTITGYVKGTSLPSPETSQKIADYFNVPRSELDPRFKPHRASKEDDPKTADLADDDTIFTFEGKPIPEQDLEYMKRLLRGGRK